jgi:hypothetical protein
MLRPSKEDEETPKRHVSFAPDGTFSTEPTSSRPPRRMTMEEQARAADRLSMRLLQLDSDDEDLAEEEIFRETDAMFGEGPTPEDEFERMSTRIESERKAVRRVKTMVILAISSMLLLGVLTFLGAKYLIGPPKEPVGPYKLIERQEGMDFFDYYTFYEGPDSVGSNGYLNYVSEEMALRLGIANVTLEEDEMKTGTLNISTRRKTESLNNTSPFIYMKSSPTPDGPRNSIRLEGKRRFFRGLFIIDLRHMPAGCGVWPAFWLTDESNWPTGGEIDVVEGVNYQSVAKTALHSTKGCSMDDIPQGTKTGTWDTSIGIPNKKTGIPDMTMRYATNCFVYDPHQWLNQGCVAVDKEGGTLGAPVNEKGGGVYALEWDPINRHIRTWVFTPHTKVPDNLRDAIETASEDEEHRVLPDPNEWPLPYGYFAIGKLQ